MWFRFLKFDQITAMRIEVNPHIHLETVEQKQAEQIFALVDANRQYLRKWMPWVDYTHAVADMVRFIEDSELQFKENNGFNAAIYYGDVLCGVIGLHKVDWLNKATAIGYWLSEDRQGKGIMTDCCRAMIRYCFNELDLQKVQINCATANFKSQAIPKRLGFIQNGVLKASELLNGEFVDHIQFVLLRQQISY